MLKLGSTRLQVVKVHIFQYTGEFNFDNRQVHKRFFSENLRFPDWEQIYYEHSALRLNNKPIMSDSI